MFLEVFWHTVCLSRSWTSLLQTPHICAFSSCSSYLKGSFPWSQTRNNFMVSTHCSVWVGPLRILDLKTFNLFLQDPKFYMELVRFIICLPLSRGFFGLCGQNSKVAYLDIPGVLPAWETAHLCRLLASCASRGLRCWSAATFTSDLGYLSTANTRLLSHIIAGTSSSARLGPLSALLAPP